MPLYECGVCLIYLIGQPKGEKLAFGRNIPDTKVKTVFATNNQEER